MLASIEDTRAVAEFVLPFGDIHENMVTISIRISANDK